MAAPLGPALWHGPDFTQQGSGAGSLGTSGRRVALGSSILHRAGPELVPLCALALLTTYVATGQRLREATGTTSKATSQLSTSGVPGLRAMGKPKEKQGKEGVGAVCGGEGACVQRPRFPLGAGGWALHQLWELQPEASGRPEP